MVEIVFQEAAVFRITDQVVVNRPVAEVFAFVADRENLPLWSSAMQESHRITDGSGASPDGVGAVYRMAGRMMGRRLEGRYERTAYENGQLLGGRAAAGPMSMTETYHFEAVGPQAAATRVSMATEIVPAGLLGLLGPLMAAGLRRQIAASHAKLKQVLETPRTS